SRAVAPLLLLFLLPSCSAREIDEELAYEDVDVAPVPSIDNVSGACADVFAAYCKPGARDERKKWLDKILADNRDADDVIKREFESARLFLSIRDDLDPENQQMRLSEGEKSKEDIEKMLKEECADFACLEKYYEPLFIFFTVYAKDYETQNDNDPRGMRAVKALTYMDRFKNTEEAHDFGQRVHMVATSANRARKYGKLKPSMFYNILLERSYVHQYRLKAEVESGIPFAAIKKVVELTTKTIGEELQKTAAGVPKQQLLGLTYLDVLKEEWRKMKAPEDDNIEEAIGFYRQAYAQGQALWRKFGENTGNILAHLSALHAINKQYPNDILDLISRDLSFDNARFLRPIEKEDRLVLPESFLVESVYRTNDKNMALFAFRLARVMLQRAFNSGMNIVDHMQDDMKECTTKEFRETFTKLYNKPHTTSKHDNDIYFMEAVQAALRTVNKDSYEPEKVRDFYARLAHEFCHDTENGAYLLNGVARFFKPFTDAFGCTESDNLFFVESKCFPLGSSNVHRRSSGDL
ncbi:hypothetical protein PFISCL1PPCAC_23862, partial [Pristionchus fissidentatus]